MTLRQPKPLRVLVHHEHIPIAVPAPEQAHRVVREPVVQGAKPLDRAAVIGIAMIVSGVLVLQLFSGAVTH